eukprot:m.99920 g.99920  ORF g.99920 m.99920 type:complete len:459 (+) comp27204_c0_seq1:166-1542(+)
MFIFDLITFCTSQVIFFIGGWIFFQRGLFKDFEVTLNAISVQLLFSLTFALSCGFLELIIFEITDVLARPSRLQFWRWTLAIMCLQLIAVIPLNICFSVVSSSAGARPLAHRVVGTIVLWLVFLIVFWKLGDPHPVDSESYGVMCLTQAIGRIAVVGVTAIAALSGFGAVYTPYTFLGYFVASPTLDHIRTQDKALLSTVNSLVQRKKRIAFAIRRQKQSAAHQQKSRGWGTSFFGSMLGGSTDVATENIELLRTEASALENLSTQLFLETHDLRAEYVRGKKLETLKGKFLHVVGHFLSGFCVYKIVMATVNILLNRVGKKDPITRGFEICVTWFGIDIDVVFWSQQLSFLLVGVLIVMSVRNILITLTKFFRFFASTNSSKMIVLIMSQVMGMYFTSLVIMMRMNMPIRYREIIIEVLGDLDFHFHHQWFDRIFLVSALSCMLTVYISRIKYQSMD